MKNIAEPVPAYRVLLDPATARKPYDVRRFPRTWRVSAAVGVLFVVLGLLAIWWQPWGLPVQLAEPKTDVESDARPSLVVLPFDNMSDDKEQEYLANGFTEDLTTELARLPGLFVVSRNAAFAYKDKATMACCRLHGHRVKVLKMEPEFSNAEKKVQPRVQA